MTTPTPADERRALKFIRRYWLTYVNSDVGALAAEFAAIRAEEREARKARDAVCDEIVSIMEVYDEQVAKNGYCDTPGGLEHMGDVWKLLDGWRAAIRARKDGT